MGDFILKVSQVKHFPWATGEGLASVAPHTWAVEVNHLRIKKTLKGALRHRIPQDVPMSVLKRAGKPKLDAARPAGVEWTKEEILPAAISHESMAEEAAGGSSGESVIHAPTQEPPYR